MGIVVIGKTLVLLAFIPVIVSYVVRDRKPTRVNYLTILSFIYSFVHSLYLLVDLLVRFFTSKFQFQWVDVHLILIGVVIPMLMTMILIG